MAPINCDEEVLVIIYFFPSLNSAAVIKLLKDICNKPGVDCTNLLTAFTGSICAHKLLISTYTLKGCLLLVT